ncbi:MAG: hypothetical protein E6343_01850 [Clostridium perfringens]|nr:hypothetical protein [Clostridium perfringens]
MDFNKLQEMIKDIIDREVQIEYDHDFKYMSEEEAGEHQSYTEESVELISKLKSKLDEEGQRALLRLMNILDSRAAQESDYYFDRGVRCGLTSLSYLSKYCNIFNK